MTEDSSSVDASSLSEASKFFLYAAGAGAVVFCIYVVYVLYRVFVFITRLLSQGARASTPVKSKKNGKAIGSTAQNGSQATKAEATPAANKGPDLKTLIKESHKAQQAKKGPKDEAASHHPLFLNTLKGHGDAVNDISWSLDGKQMVTACDDMYVRVFDMSDVASREPKFWRIKTPRTPLGAGFADSRGQQISVVMRGIPDTVMAVYTPATAKNAEGNTIEQLWQVGNIHGKEPALAMRGVPTTTRAGIVASLSTKKDLQVYSVNGKQLAGLEINSLGNHDLAVSADGRFLAVASFTSEVKIWEVKYSRDVGDVTGVFKAMELKGHKKKVMSVALSPDNKRAVTVSQDGTLRVWNIDVRYGMSEDPKTVLTIAMPLANGRCYQRLAISPTGVIAASYEGTVHLLSMTTGDLLDSIEAHEGTICTMHWCSTLLKAPGSKEPTAVLATCGRDKRVRMWRAP